MTSSDRGETERDHAVLVVSKPYQLLMGLSALEQFDRTAHVFTVDAGFRDPQAFVDLLRGHPSFERIASHTIISDHDAIRRYSARIANTDLLVEDDRVSLYELFAGLAPRSLSVIEEGLGTYFGHYWSKSKTIVDRFKAIKWAARGIGTGSGITIGGGRMTRAVFCTRPRLFARLKPALSHKACAIDGLASYRAHFSILLQDRIDAAEGDHATLALLGWTSPSPAQLREWAGNARAFYYKPHPHRPDPLGHFGVGTLLPHAIPAEFVIDFLARRHKRLTVYHGGSSACLLYPFEKAPGLSFQATTQKWFMRRLEIAQTLA